MPELKAQINSKQMDVMRLGKATLAAIAEAGALLQQQCDEDPDGFEDWVATELPIDYATAVCCMAWHKQAPIAQLSPVYALLHSDLFDMLVDLAVDCVPE